MIKNMIKEKPLYKLIIDAVLLIVALLGVFVSIKMNIVGRSLWYDEAALAYSFVTRSFFELTSTGLDLVQSAPVGWLYVLKIFCIIFGYTDSVMRIPSIIAYIGVLVLLGYISKKILKMYYYLAPVAFAASLPLLLQYSNMFKPYITDAFFALLIICLFYWHREKKLNVYVMGVLWGVILWFSSTACFVEGGLIIASFIICLMSKDKEIIKKRTISLVKIGVIILIFFGIYYVYWLRKVDDGMHGFWADWSFIFIPTSMQDVSDMKRMISALFEPFYYYKMVVLILCVLALVIAIIKRSEYILGVYTIALITAFASAIGMYPVNKRLWLFMYPLVILASFYVLDFIVDRTDIKNNRSLRNILLGVALSCMCICNAGIRYYMHDSYVYWPRYEVKGEMEYLDEIIEEGDGVYVLSSAAPMFLFYNHYNTSTLENTGNSVVVATASFAPDYDGNITDHTDEINYILSHDKCYIVMSDTWDDESNYGELYNRLQKEGSLTMVYNEHATPLFLFTKNK